MTTSHERFEAAASAWEAERLLLRFYGALDAGAFELMAAGMADDGVWHRQGKVLRGPAMVREALAARDPGARSRHLITNMIVDFDAPDEARAGFHMTVFRHDGAPDAKGPAPMDLPVAVSTCRARLRRQAGEWRIAELSSEVAFRR